ncbi:SDR family NAD(P)-dependent oxidoreductase, partial [Buchnera aphidicola (Hormaphis cornu)]
MRNRDMLINKKIAIVTGANKGIGKTIAIKLSNQGIFVIGTSTSKVGVKKINNQLKNKGKGMLLNITNYEHVTQTIKNIYKEFNSIDILVNNAGINKDNFLLLMST